MILASTHKITIIDNFLSDCNFLDLKKFLFSNQLPWVFGSHKVYDDNDDLENYQMVHTFQNADSGQTSSEIEKLNMFMNKLNIQGLYRIKANLEGYKNNKPYYSKFHVDVTKDDVPIFSNEGFTLKSINNITTGIFYVNTCNGYTEFEDGTIVNSVGNRFVSFPANTKHRGVSQTDTKARIVINFNYWTND